MSSTINKNNKIISNDQKLILILFVTLYSTMVPIVAQQASTNSLDAQKEKEWSGLQMPSWVFSSIGVFIQ